MLCLHRKHIVSKIPLRYSEGITIKSLNDNTTPIKIRRVATGNCVTITDIRLEKDNQIYYYNGIIETTLIKNVILVRYECFSIMEDDQINHKNTTANLMDACAFGNKLYTMIAENGETQEMKLDGSIKIIKPDTRLILKFRHQKPLWIGSRIDYDCNYGVLTYDISSKLYARSFPHHEMTP